MYVGMIPAKCRNRVYWWLFLHFAGIFRVSFLQFSQEVSYKMPTQYTLAEAARRLGIDRRTLYNWLQKTGIATEEAEADKRAALLSESQVRALAKAHGRALLSLTSKESIQTTLETHDALLEEYERRIAALERAILPAERPARPPLPEETPAPRAPEGSGPALAGALKKTDAARLVADRHGVSFNTAKGWPWPPSALADERAAILWSLNYVAATSRQKPQGWRARCTVSSCPCQE